MKSIALVLSKTSGKKRVKPRSIIKGSGNVFANGRPVATRGSIVVNPLGIVVRGSSSVFVNGKPIARLGDLCDKGDKIITNTSKNVFSD